MKRTIITIYTLSFVILTFNGCTAALMDPEINFEPPAYVEQMPARDDEQNFSSTGSIFGQGDNPLFSDHKAMNVSDIVTVVISETAQSSNTGAKQLSETDTATLGGGLFSSAGGANGRVAGGIAGLNGYTDVGFNTNSVSTFQGQGSATKDASFTTTVSARIVKVLKNGNYFISGKREMLIDDQKQIIQISGVIRPYDIDQNNNINSAQMSDAKILYKTEGDMDRATEQGWGSKMVQAIWPF
ncbi:flagellar basal body L-ring protein FlgH [Sulfurimonas aquatica]|uniref:Flagellar L-ring protein n=1 Tax=Sulfurimonas aquatica TaxID=2672570 RepID=A0A975GCA7_9BACT|nr:flagellar basal body L-ring protein FlgH [Sulfurimonas aquatica]QSZ41526.1 flagellar basal body L-ring protein FlgH [Sulfurimonas aquatica]